MSAIVLGQEDASLCPLMLPAYPLIVSGLSFRLPAPGQQLVQAIDSHLAGDDPFQGIAEPSLGIDVVELGGVDEGGKDRQVSPPRALSANNAFLRVKATDFIERSTTLESTSARPSARNTISPDQWFSIYRHALLNEYWLDVSSTSSVRRLFSSAMIGALSACRTLRRISALVPRIRASIR